MAGKRYTVAPIPPDPAHTRYLDAGALRLGIEYRVLDAPALESAYGDDAAAMQEIQANLPVQGANDRGLSIHVLGAEDGHEYLRFDVFETGPHYHYIAPSGVEQTIVDFDVVAHGDMLPWALAQLRSRLPQMLERAGGAHLVPRLDADLLAARVEELRILASEARQRLGIRALPS